MTRWAVGFRAGLGMLAAVVLWTGCETEKLANEGTVTLAQLQGIYEAPPEETPAAEEPSTGTSGESGGTTGGSEPTDAGWPAEIDGPIHWLHTDVSGWAVTASLKASVSGGTIHMPYNKAKVWHSVGGLNANPWVIVKMNGQWYAATFEWFRYGQTSKPVGVLNGSMGDHIKVSPLNRWRPRSGERIGFMVSGLARAQSRNVKERSNVSMVTWP
ncbi:MAG: hypothetical protein GX548_01290 [Lentisphaerae bacterium]|nr:hypothetical protein [Lentisphaerota bacterium]